ncbi:hypothetical protein ACPV5U_24310 [Vibrio mediterranei]
MESLFSKSVIALIVGVILSGCTSKESAQEPIAGAMNQPQLDEVTAITPQPAMATATNIPTIRKDEYKFVGVVHEKGKGEANLKTASSKQTHKVKSPSIPTVTRITTGVTIFDENGYRWEVGSRTKSYLVEKGDTYEEALSKWLKEAGYKSFTKSLSRNEEKAMKQRIGQSDAFFTHFPDAINRLIDMAINQAKTDKRQAYEGGLSTEGRANLSFALQLDNLNKTAKLETATPAIIIKTKVSPIKPATEKTNYYSVYKGETYVDVLQRWLGDRGYVKFGMLLDDPEKKAIEQIIPASDSYYQTFSVAATQLLDQAISQARKDERDERQRWLSDNEKNELRLFFSFDGLKKEAILTSSHQPTVMFTVAKGSLKDNFLRLAAMYGWNADESHYISKNYKVSFSYPIVTEEGNVKQALAELLADFPNLRGGIVPSTRSVFVQTEK